MTTEKTNDGSVRSVERALNILKCFSLSEPRLTLGQISKRLGLPKSTVHRLLKSLQDNRFVEQDTESGKYRLSYAVVRMGMVATEDNTLRNVALPVMRDMAKITKQTCNLYVVSGCKRLCIEQVEGPEYVKRYSYVGALFPLYGGASGKVLLAFQDEEWLTCYFHKVLLRRMTERTTTDRETLMGQLQVIRKQRYAATFGERDILTASVAAPIFNLSGNLAAAMAVSGPIMMFTDENIKRYAAELIKAAESISLQLGYQQ